MKNTAKFFIACAVIFGIGLLTTALGAAFGGIENFGKVAEERGWGYSGPGDAVAKYGGVEDFDAVEVNADVDVYLVSEKYFTNKAWRKEHDLTDALPKEISGIVNDHPLDSDSFVPKAGYVLTIHGSKIEAPEISVKKGVLYIGSTEKASDKLHVNFSSVSVTPRVYVFCRENVLKSITVNEFSGDAALYGVSFNKASIDSASGDVLMSDIKGNKANLELSGGDASISGVIKSSTEITADAGDIDLNGTFKGSTVLELASGDAELEGKFRGEVDIDSATGDVDFNTDLTSDKYDINFEAFGGDIEIREFGSESQEYSNQTYTSKGSPHKLTIKVLAGDIDAGFGPVDD